MSEELLNIVKELAQSIAPYCIMAVGYFIIVALKKASAFLKTKANESNISYVNKYIDMIEKTIADCVEATNQTFVDTAKSNGVFDQEAWSTAFQKSKANILLMINDSQKELITQLYGDFDNWVNTQIEAEVKRLKKEQKLNEGTPIVQINQSGSAEAPEVCLAE